MFGLSEEVEEDANRRLDYQLCEFEGTRLSFRGPAPDFDQPYVAVLGGNETYGKYVQNPFPDLLGDWIETPVMNLGVQQAGLSLFAEERWLLDIASKAEVTVLQVLGAQNMSNRLYSVHSRRNDRFLGVSPALRNMYPTVDFSQINFTGHLLETLSQQSRGAFAVLMEELKFSWVQRMRRLVRTIESDVVLLWVSDRHPDQSGNHLHQSEPMFVDRTMLNELAGDVCGIVEVVSRSDPSLDGKVCSANEVDAAQLLPGPADHARIAEALASELARLRENPGETTSARVTNQSFSINSGSAVKRSATRP